MPDYLPHHLFLVHLSGICEIICGLSMAWKKTRVWGCYLSMALLIAVFPANINMLQHSERFPDISESALWMRLPLQFAGLYWIYWISKRTKNAKQLVSN